MNTKKLSEPWNKVDELERDDEFQRNHDNWDFENIEVHEPVKNFKVVYSVRFEKADIRDVRQAAEAAGVTTSAFIRNAALAAARGESAAQLHAAVTELREAVERASAALRVFEANESAAGERLAG